MIIEYLVNLVVGIIGFLGYGGVFGLMLLESCGILAPSEAIMPFAGFLVAQGQMNLWLVIILGALGNLVGSLIAYWIGKAGGRPLVEKYGRYLLISRHDLDTADRWFKRRGGLMVFIGRLLPVVRTYISFPAGIAKMNLKKFIVYTLAGVLLWSGLFAWLGLKLGENWELIRAKLHNFDIAIVVLLGAAIIWYIYRHVKASRHPV